MTFLDENFENPASSSTIANEYLYTGRRLDPETGLQLNRNRFYASHLGRWVNRDPINYGGGPNLYGYVRERPTYYEDPYGLVGFQIEFPNEIWGPYPDDDFVLPCTTCAPIIAPDPIIFPGRPGGLPGWVKWPPQATVRLPYPDNLFPLPRGGTLECTILVEPGIDYDPDDPFRPGFDFDFGIRPIIKY